MKTTLLIIDIQNEYFPGGKRELVRPLEAALNAYNLLQCFREHHKPTVHIQHISTGQDAEAFLAGTPGAHIHDTVAHFEGEPLVIKHHPNSFRETNLLELLKSWNTERVIITGMMSHMCVDATARAAVDHGFSLYVAEDACATRNLAFGDTTVPAEQVHKAFMAALMGYGKVMKAEEILAHLAVEHAGS